MTRRERLGDENDPGDRQFRESGSDGRIRSSRVGKRFAQVRSSSLSFFLSSSSSCFFVSLTLFYCVRNSSLFRSFVLSIFLSRASSVVLGVSFAQRKQKKQLDQLRGRRRRRRTKGRQERKGVKEETHLEARRYRA